ncbi:MAG: hypothetical protein A3G25_05700 [Betaproteobacteria bacterium RIFCSPLOWO2_12_FULL_63_13]|nr:MAG: hypothetical protein A3G25_05700 [Betaproteobacteria bacterium RIFCSPLOWO2_12_FULL_63_13]
MLKNRRKNGSCNKGFDSAALRAFTEMSTTAGVTRASIGAIDGTGPPAGGAVARNCRRTRHR